jgi:hypothetical protein
MLLVLGQNWDHVLLRKEVKGTGMHSTAYLRIKTGGHFVCGLLGPHYTYRALRNSALCQRLLVSI